MVLGDVWRHFRESLRKGRKQPFSFPRFRLLGFSGLQMTWSPDNAVAVAGRVDGTIRLIGQRNTVEVASRAVIRGHITVEGHDNTVFVEEDCRLTATITVKGNRQTVRIGRKTTCQSLYLLCQEGCHVTIGAHCMLSRDVEIRTTDAHSLIDRKSGRRLNTPASISIGDHVWIGTGVLISKGSVIPDDCTIGAKSFVNKAFTETGLVLAGTPARIVRRETTWNRGRKRRFTPDEMKIWKP